MLSTSKLTATCIRDFIFDFCAGAYKVEIDLMQPIDPEKAPKVLRLLMTSHFAVTRISNSAV